MNRPSSMWRLRGVVIALVLLAGGPVSAQDTLAAARELYAAAAYEEALVLLNRLAGPKTRPAEGQLIEQYRALCLLALGRTVEAEQAIEAVVAARPLYHPSDQEASPRVRSAFSAVRQRMLPDIVHRTYAQARTVFDRGEFAQAASSFDAVLELLADPDLASAVKQPPLSDLRTLAQGFRDLSAKAIPPPPPPPPSVVAPAEPAAPSTPRTYHAGDADVVPPVAVRQTLPRFPGRVVAESRGILELVINEAGDVESARMTVPVDPVYDRIALAAARDWKYEPATKAGAPVKFRKLLNISLTPRP